MPKATAMVEDQGAVAAEDAKAHSPGHVEADLDQATEPAATEANHEPIPAAHPSLQEAEPHSSL